MNTLNGIMDIVPIASWVDHFFNNGKESSVKGESFNFLLKAQGFMESHPALGLFTSLFAPNLMVGLDGASAILDLKENTKSMNHPGLKIFLLMAFGGCCLIGNINFQKISLPNSLRVFLKEEADLDAHVLSWVSSKPSPTLFENFVYRCRLRMMGFKKVPQLIKRVDERGLSTPVYNLTPSLKVPRLPSRNV